MADSAETGGPRAEKAAWRRWAHRVAVPVSEAEAEAVRANLARFLGPIEGVVVSYDALPGEVDPEPVLVARGPERWALTRTPPSGGLTINLVTSGLERHRFGFRQPVPTAPVVPDAEVGAILVPGLAFDRTGIRLGHGAGYYDRLLARFSGRVPLVGVGSWATIVERLPFEGHDVALTHLVTESGTEPTGSGTGARDR
ncbi:MAG TPA: 5-formyltetrahydrofolate cyclo-ligase [Acidimicrobiales bacterium]|nr:5-formyltetrahydrofolate cyclo-ligase [Acidimicrobiales bacterium]